MCPYDIPTDHTEKVFRSQVITPGLRHFAWENSTMNIPSQDPDALREMHDREQRNWLTTPKTPTTHARPAVTDDLCSFTFDSLL